MRAKDEVRRDVWRAMDRTGVSRFPGAQGRIPNFAGAREAAERLAGHPAWQRARALKVNPDSRRPTPGASRWPRARRS